MIRKGISLNTTHQALSTFPVVEKQPHCKSIPLIPACIPANKKITSKTVKTNTAPDEKIPKARNKPEINSIQGNTIATKLVNFNGNILKYPTFFANRSG